MKIVCNSQNYLPLFPDYFLTPSSANDASFCSVFWDGGRILFDISVDKKRIACAISRAALEGISGGHHIGAASLVRCFMAQRGRIEAIARGKVADAGSGTLNVWASDCDDFLPTDTPSGARKVIHRLMA